MNAVAIGYEAAWPSVQIQQARFQNLSGIIDEAKSAACALDLLRAALERTPDPFSRRQIERAMDEAESALLGFLNELGVAIDRGHL